MLAPMVSVSTGRGPITEAMQESCLWTGSAVNSPAAVYLSAGEDSRMLTVTEPTHMRSRAVDVTGLEPFAFYVFVDQKYPQDNASMHFDDGRTVIDEWHAEQLTIGPYPAWHLNLIVKSDRYGERNVSVLRIKSTNDQFTELALAEDWKTHCLITVLDGCTGFGDQPSRRNAPALCENDITTSRSTNLVKLNPDWLITDHFNGPSRGLPNAELVRGEEIKSTGQGSCDLSFKYACDLASPQWPSYGEQDRDRYVRLYAVESSQRK
jgi:hypothetical protein